jgi:hypothetical protein
MESRVRYHFVNLPFRQLAVLSTHMTEIVLSKNFIFGIMRYHEVSRGIMRYHEVS